MSAEVRLARLQADALLAQRQPRAALAAYDAAEVLGADPDHCAGQRWTCLMLLGEYERAWQQSDALRARNAPDPHRVWDGTPLAGRRVMVRSVHGLGDAVQMLRYMPLLRRQAARLTLQVAPPLVALAQCTSGVDEVIAWEHERPFDVQLEITELPYAFRSTPDTLPHAVPYLARAPLLQQAARTWLGERVRPRVGLVWTSSAWDSLRSLPLASLEPVLHAGAGHVDFWCLQPRGISEDWTQVCRQRGWPERRAGNHPLDLFAACVAEMDLVITIDSFAAHLAGALGIPAWVMLKQQADWRWMLERSDSLWYPTLHLLRQSVAGDWSSVVAQAANKLTAWTGAAELL